MPESKRRKPRKPNTARQFLAARDGETIKVTACCHIHIVLGVARIGVRHDDHCPALRPASPKFLIARAQANEAVARVLGDRGLPTLPIMVVS